MKHVEQVVGPDAQFNKSKALNLGACHARGDTLILLDGDLLIPVHFAAECARALASSHAARPARWVAYLDATATQRIENDKQIAAQQIVDVIANLPMPLAVRRSTYWEIGGHDEAYEGWGGEDLEFLSRIRTRSICEGGWLPLLHLWHSPASKKKSGDRNRLLHTQKMRVPRLERINRLKMENHGHGPT